MKKGWFFIFLIVFAIASRWVWKISVIRNEHHLSWQESIRYYYETDQQRNARKDAKILAKYNEQLACRPEKPLSEGELFARAMQDYWRIEMERTKRSNDSMNAEFGQEIPRKLKSVIWAYGSVCLYEYDKNAKDNFVINEENCYPRILRDNNTIEKLYHQGLVLSSENGNIWNDYRFIRNLLETNPAYHPETDPYLYSPEEYNRQTDFAMYSTAMMQWYPKDCCTIVNYEQMLKIRKKMGEFKGYPTYMSDWRPDILPLDQLQGQYFLLRKYVRTSLTKGRIYDFVFDEKFRRMAMRYHFNPITPCGEVIWWN